MANQYAEALTEVDMILKIMPEEISKKIPLSFYNFIAENKSNTFKTSAIDTIFIDESKLKNETKAFLALIYISYLCDEATKNRIKNQDYIALQKYHEEQKNKYSIDNLFKNNSSPLDSNISKNTTTNELTVVKTEKWYTRFLNRIKSLFSKKQ